MTKLENAASVKQGDGSSILKRDCVFADCSCSVLFCSVRLVLWEGDIDKLVLSDSYKLINVCVRQWQGVLFIYLSGDTTIRAIDDIGDVDENLILSRSQT